MKITPQVFSLPPYISTTWQHVAALHVRHEDAALLLVVDLMNGNRIEIPRLDSTILEQIFAAHAAFNEGSAEIERATQKTLGLNEIASFNLHVPSQFFGEGFEKFSGVLQHNPEAADTDDLPQELLDKVATIAKSLGIEDTSTFPSPVENCNCLFCQITRAIHASGQKQENIPLDIDEEVSEEDLRFKTWDIQQTGHQMYEVTNPLDTNEHYNVFLGDPLGCTCGHPHCEHICAVLKT